MKHSFVDLLDIGMEDMGTADPLYRPTSFWEKACTQLASQIKEFGIEQFKSLPLPLTFFVPTYGFPGYHKGDISYQPVRDALTSVSDAPTRLCLRLGDLMSGNTQAVSDYRVLLASDRDQPPYLDKCSESKVGSPVEQFEFDGRRFSRSFLNYMLGLTFLKTHCDTTSIRNVVEIGGGHGALGEILLSDNRNDSFYLNYDLPPTGTVATWYLQSVFGADAVLDYADTRDWDSIDIEGIRASHRAAVLTPWQLPRTTGNIDLFVNYISFQEMEPEIVSNYLYHIQKLSPQYILLRNIREGKQVATDPQSLGVKKPILGDDYDGFLDGYKLVASNVMPFGHLTEDGFHSELRLYVRC